MTCKYDKKESFWVQIALPIVLTGMTVVGAVFGTCIADKFNKATLLGVFKDDLLKPNGPKYVLAREALRKYYDSEDWDIFIASIISAEQSKLEKSLSDDNLQETKQNLDHLETIFEYERIYTKKEFSGGSIDTSPTIINGSLVLKKLIKQKSDKDPSLMKNYKNVEAWLNLKE